MLVVLAYLGNATRLSISNVVLLIGLDGLVVHATLMLRHQDVILFPLLFSLDLSIEVVDVLLLNLFLLFNTLLLNFFNFLHALYHLIGINGVVSPIESLLLLFLLHLTHEGRCGIIFVSVLSVTLSVYVSLLLRVSLRHLLQHHLLVFFGCLNQVFRPFKVL